MVHGRRIKGEGSWDPLRREIRWRLDHLPELGNDDALYGFAIRASKELRLVDWSEVNDPVLHRLLTMGIFDWNLPDNRLHQATQAIRFSTALDTRLLGRILQLERKVSWLRDCEVFTI